MGRQRTVKQKMCVEKDDETKIQGSVLKDGKEDTVECLINKESKFLL